ncbi:Nucleotidylyl transferase [Byssothecium circinans]|uniref:Tryptophan--tRNA ligase, cytoplasmic n=1 Tax=Byssothecium circinans TaxID=147558 RepID=A0A6A5UJK7_9PLEO|nr:Nucleotidylyl transferase [Byssothecium circinans]
MEASVRTRDTLSTPITTPSADISGDTSQDINPWSVTGAIVDGKPQAINYNHLVETFGTRLITGDLLQRFKQVTGHEPHVFMRRGLVFSHRDLETILDRHEKGQPFYLYTGRGPSNVFDVPLVIMMTDDEKFLFGKKAYTMDEMRTFVRGNARDILAVGFDPKKTFLFSDFEFMGAKPSLASTTGIDSVGKAHFVSVQTSASFATTFPHIFGTNTGETSEIPSLIPCAIDQDPYFRVCRDVAPRLGYAKPSLLHAKFFPALQGPGSKMSASVDSSAIFMSDTRKQIEKKINKYAFSGGRETAEEQRRLGGDPDVDVAYQYLSFFTEDDEELKRIEEAYRKGEMLTGELKKKCILKLQDFIGAFQTRRASIDDAVLDEFMTVRPLVWGTKKGDPNGETK